MKGNYSFEALFTAVRNIVVYHQIPFTIFFLALLGIAYNQKTSLHLGMGLFMFFLFWWLIQPKPYLRFCNFILPVILISGVLCYQNLNSVIMRHGYKVIIGITLLYGIVVGIFYSQSYFDYFIHRDLKQYHKATWFYNEYDWINKNLPTDTNLLVIVLSGHTYYLKRSYLRADPFLSGLIDWCALKDSEALHKKLSLLNIDYILYEDRNWSAYPGGQNMMDLIKRLSSSAMNQVIWTRNILLYTSRIRGRYNKSKVSLIKLNQQATVPDSTFNDDLYDMAM